jgi:excisionase family DNA binding protein
MKPSKSASTSSRFSDLLWNEDDLSAAIGVSVKRVQELARQGIIPAFKLGRNWRFDPDAIRTWIKASTRSEQHSHTDAV